MAFQNFVMSKFPQSELKDLHHGLVLYQISTSDASLAQVYMSFPYPYVLSIFPTLRLPTPYIPFSHFLKFISPFPFLKPNIPCLFDIFPFFKSGNYLQVFSAMESNKESLFVEDYSVSQTSLEQIFINFARAQIPPLEDEGRNLCKCCCWCR